MPFANLIFFTSTMVQCLSTLINQLTTVSSNHLSIPLHIHFALKRFAFFTLQVNYEVAFLTMSLPNLTSLLFIFITQALKSILTSMSLQIFTQSLVVTTYFDFIPKNIADIHPQLRYLLKISSPLATLFTLKIFSMWYVDSLIVQRPLSVSLQIVTTI